MSDANTAKDSYLTGLRNQHAVETQAIGTIQNELPRMKPYPELYARMQQDHERSTQQAARLDDLLAKHGSSKSLAKEAVTGAVATLAGFAHVTAGDEVLKNVLAAIGYKAYEIASYKVLLTLAEESGASEDKAVLETSMKEEQEMGDWLGEHIPSFVHAYLGQKGA
jgi:ferritin-like metal-binding protein YciE